mmetsp:Transcript_15994/g.42240  ORF Transcript_15994/g.42240 Transcript_15994/m.42240 type:complete len:303 (-) Transcript_15994:74-982(-)
MHRQRPRGARPEAADDCSRDSHLGGLRVLEVAARHEAELHCVDTGEQRALEAVVLAHSEHCVHAHVLQGAQEIRVGGDFGPVRPYNVEHGDILLACRPLLGREHIDEDGSPYAAWPVLATQDPCEAPREAELDHGGGDLWILRGVAEPARSLFGLLQRRSVQPLVSVLGLEAQRLGKGAIDGTPTHAEVIVPGVDRGGVHRRGFVVDRRETLTLRLAAEGQGRQHVRVNIDFLGVLLETNLNRAIQLKAGIVRSPAHFDLQPLRADALDRDKAAGSQLARGALCELALLEIEVEDLDLEVAS